MVLQSIDGMMMMNCLCCHYLRVLITMMQVVCVQTERESDEGLTFEKA
jgi:hypothetical protein